MAGINNKNLTIAGNRISGLDYYIIVGDVLKEWLAILLFVAAAGLFTHVWFSRQYVPQYTTTATMVVSTGGTTYNVNRNASAAAQTAGRFSQILNSSLLQKKVAEEIGLNGFVGRASAENIKGTNLLIIRVTSPSPEISFREMKSILNNHHVVSEYLLGNIILETLEAPTVAVRPDNQPKTMERVRFAMFAAAAGMILFLALLSVLRDTIRSAEDVEKKLDCRLLEEIAHEEKYKTILSRIRKEKKSVLITDPTVTFRYVETIKRLARKTINRMDERGARSLLITSVMENEGKSTVATNLAIAITQEGKSAVLIDCDFRKPSLYKVLGYSDKTFYSLGNVLKNDEPIDEYLAIRLPGTDLEVVLNKVEFPDSTNMLSSGILKKTFDYYLDRVDYVILDTSPMALVADAEEMASMVDVTAIVVRQHLVEAKYINDSIDALNTGESRMIGCILNDVHVHGRGRTEAYGLTYGGHYEY